MSERPTIKRNMVWNTIGLGVEAVAGFLTLPFLLAKLGSTTYGVWLVLGALTSYFGLLELGARGAIGRHIALYHSQGNRIAANQTLTCGVVALLGAGLIACLTLVLCEPLFLRFYQIPEDEQAHVSAAFYLVAINFVVALLSTAFDAALWGLQRFDWLNAIDIPIALSRLAATFVFIRSSSDLVVLAAITLSMSGTSLLAKVFLYFRADPAAQIGVRYLTRSALGELFGYGIWNALSTLALLSRTQFGPLLIGALVGLTFVPLFALANRLLTTVAAVVGAVTGVLAPHATALHATNQAERQRELFLVGGRHAAALGVFLVAYLLALGPPLITLWVGPAFSTATTLLIVLVWGELLPSTQYVTNAIILATARHRALALFATFEAVAVCSLMVILLPMLGLIGAGVAVAIPSFLARGVAPMIHGCRILDVPVRRYVLRTLIPPILCGALPVLAVRLVLAISPIDTWPVFLGYSAGYTLLFGLCYACALGRRRLTRLSRRTLFAKQLPLGEQVVCSSECS